MKIKKRWYALFTAPLMIVFFIIMVVSYFYCQNDSIYSCYSCYRKFTCACIRAARDNEAESKEYSADNVVSSVSDRRSDSRVYLAVCIRRGDDFLERDDRNGESVF